VESISEDMSRGLGEVGVMSMSLDFEDAEVVAFVTLELPAKEMVFWEPFAAGPDDTRERRVGGILLSKMIQCVWFWLSGLMYEGVTCRNGRGEMVDWQGNTRENEARQGWKPLSAWDKCTNKE